MPLQFGPGSEGRGKVEYAFQTDRQGQMLQFGPGSEGRGKDPSQPADKLGAAASIRPRL